MQSTPNKELEAMQAEIEKQVAEYLAGGGKIQKIPVGVMGDPPPPKKSSGLVAMTRAAELAGVSRTALYREIENGTLKKHGNKLDADEVLRLFKKLPEEKAGRKPLDVDRKTARRMFLRWSSKKSTLQQLAKENECSPSTIKQLFGRYGLSYNNKASNS